MPAQQPPPEPVRVPPALGWPLLYGFVLVIAAILFQLAHPFSPWWFLLAFPVVGAGGTAVSFDVASESRCGFAFPRWCSMFAFLLGLATTIWMVWTAKSGLSATWSVFGIGWLALTVVFAVLVYVGARLEMPEREAVVSPSSDRWRDVLDAADCKDLAIVRRREHRAGVDLTLHITGSAAVAEVMNRAGKLATQAARAYRLDGQVLPQNAVRFDPGAADDEVVLHVTTRRPLAGEVAYVPDRRAGDITKPLRIGEYEDGDPVLLTLLRKCWLMVGAPGSGKTVLTHNLIARISACSNALVWVGGASVPPLVWGWVLPWLRGEASRPAIDRVACSEQATREMLRDAWALVSTRKAKPIPKQEPTSSEPAVVVIIEEAATALEDREKILCHDGQRRTSAELVAVLGRAGRSAGVPVLLMTQTALTAAWGSRGVEVIRLFVGRICLQTAMPGDGDKIINGLRGMTTNQLTDHKMLVQTDSTSGRYAPAKAAKLEGEDVAPFAVTHADWRPDGVEVALGGDYDDRWTPEAQPELHAYAQEQELTWPVQVLIEVAAVNADIQEPVMDVSTPDPGWGVDDDIAVAQLLGGSASAAVVDRLFGAKPKEVPSPLKEILAWLDANHASDDDWVLTEHAATAIGWNPLKLGKALNGLKVSTGNTPREAGLNQRRGFQVRSVRRAAR
jgi:hypothetical protein